MGRLEGDGAVRREVHTRAALVAAYREGLGLVAITAICIPSGIRIIVAGANDGVLASDDAAMRRWWCRSADEARCTAAAARASMRRRQSTSIGQTDSLHIAEQAIASAAKRIAIALYTDDEISAEAMAIIARVDDAMERLQRAGELKSVNKSYRAYRIEASARAEKIVTYTEWMRKYRERLVRDAAAALR